MNEDAKTETTPSDQSGKEAGEKPASAAAKSSKTFVATAKTRLARKTGRKAGHAHHAYTLVPNPDKPGHCFAVRLRDVTFKEAVFLEPNESSESIMRCLARTENDMRKRSKRGTWGKE